VAGLGTVSDKPVARARGTVWPTSLLSVAQACSKGLVGWQWAPCFAVNMCIRKWEVVFSCGGKIHLEKKGEHLARVSDKLRW